LEFLIIMQERHKNRDKYFQEQSYTTKKYVIPFLAEVKNIDTELEVLEIGCGEGGNLEPFLSAGFKVTGVDILESKIKNANKFFENHEKRGNLQLIVSDIYEPVKDLDQKFDIVFMRDVLEHIHDQEKFMAYVKRFLKPDGLFFLGFPPWQNPFGGHQQTCKSRFLSKLPWFHLLPGKLYPWTLKLFKEHKVTIESLLEIKETRIHIERFRRIVKNENYSILREEFWFINPNYEVKFGMKPRKMNSFLGGIPYVRNLFITTNYYILGLK